MGNNDEFYRSDTKKSAGLGLSLLKTFLMRGVFKACAESAYSSFFKKYAKF
ncbi:Uncharacterized protein dnm_012760 [Desulfonema magnum]|uniref:Uncharacterized protein n=1 Tax=Desulfonema magnum TaxID=45655 RepID=A0A975GKY3_9BACT|nr:Uncharacterized protein dnm_012760 [Desulfonema magnum]